MIYLSEQLGGAKAAALVKDRVLTMEAFRKISAPTKARTILHQLAIPVDVLDKAMASKQAHTSIDQQLLPSRFPDGPTCVSILLPQ